MFPSTMLRKSARRSIFNVPGNDVKKVTKAKSLLADVIVLDLEDGVPPGQAKHEARKNISECLLGSGDKWKAGELAVRINSLESGLLEMDLRALAENGALNTIDAIILPKTQTYLDLHYLWHQLKFYQNGKSPKQQIFACMESAKSLLALENIVEKGSARFNVTALVYSAEDFCADAGIVRTENRSELLYSRSSLVTHAKAYGLDAIDMVCLDFRSENVLREECQEAVCLGFTGKQAIHPAQITAINETFSPSPADVIRATEILSRYEQLALKDGTVGAFDYKGKVIDLPVVKQMQKLLSRNNFSLNKK